VVIGVAVTAQKKIFHGQANLPLRTRQRRQRLWFDKKKLFPGVTLARHATN
jgi:hypothetical protein